MVNWSKGDKVFFLGIGGSGMRGLARIMENSGVVVMGSESDLVMQEELKGKYNWLVFDEDSAVEKIKGVEVLIYTDAVREDHSLRRQARKNGIVELSYAQALGLVSREYDNVLAIAGTHGKTSTCGLVAKIFIEAGYDPTVLIGGVVKEWGNSGAYLGGNEWLIVEADEYRSHFLELQWNGAIVTNIDYDHPDAFESTEVIKKLFSSFFDNGELGSIVVTTAKTLSENPEVAWPADTVVGNCLEAVIEGKPGKHWQSNAGLAIELATRFGIDAVNSARSVSNPYEVGRRLEVLKTRGERKLISDYGHHPEEIRATLAGLKLVEKMELTVVLEIHTAERLKVFFNEYIKSLNSVSKIILVPVFVPAGREQHVKERAKQMRHEMTVVLQSQGKEVIELDDDDAIMKSIDTELESSSVIVFTAGRMDQVLRRK